MRTIYAAIAVLSAAPQQPNFTGCRLTAMTFWGRRQGSASRLHTGRMIFPRKPERQAPRPSCSPVGLHVFSLFNVSTYDPPTRFARVDMHNTTNKITKSTFSTTIDQPFLLWCICIRYSSFMCVCVCSMLGNVCYWLACESAPNFETRRAAQHRANLVQRRNDLLKKKVSM